MLTSFEKKILQLLAAGLTKQETAEKLRVNLYTLDGYVRKVFEKLEVHSIAAAVAEAMRGKEIE